MDLKQPIPPVEELMADGGRLLVIHVLREMPYHEYLQTVHWQRVREYVMKRDGWRCVVCLGRTRPEVHHITYENRGCEEDQDVATLCREHHEAQHEILRTVMRARIHGRLEE